MASPVGATASVVDANVGASQLTEMNGSAKVGSGGPIISNNKTIDLRPPVRKTFKTMFDDWNA